MKKITAFINKDGAAVLALLGAFSVFLHSVSPPVAEALGDDMQMLSVVVTFVSSAIAVFAPSDSD